MGYFDAAAALGGWTSARAWGGQALVAARALRDAADEPARLRLVIHCGPVRISEQDVFGSEVHRLFRLEALAERDRADAPAAGLALAALPGRVTLSAVHARPGPHLTA